MSQVSVSSATAHGRSPWHVLRPVLVLGGFVAVWWALMTGVAQADSTPAHTPPHNLVDQIRSQAKAQQPSEHRATPVRDAVRRVHHDVKAQTSKATPKVRHQVREVVRPVTRTVSTVVDSTPLAPVVHQATGTIRTTTSKTLATTRALLAQTAAGPVVDPVIGAVEDTVKEAVERPESSTGQGNSHSKRHFTKAATTSFADLLSSAPGQQSESSAALQAGPSSDADQPLDGPRGAPPVHDPCASPSGSSSTSITPAGSTESSWLVMPSVLGDVRTWRLARLPGGPAYQPGSSPD